MTHSITLILPYMVLGVLRNLYVNPACYRHQCGWKVGVLPPPLLTITELELNLFLAVPLLQALIGLAI